MKCTFVTSAVALAVLLAACSGGDPKAAAVRGADPSGSAGETVQSYTCPMHPHYMSTDPDGTCPICGMDLIPAKSATAASSGKDGVLYYKNPMGLPDTSPVPKKDSMGMDYIPVYADVGTGSGVVVSSEMLQTMGVRTARVSRASFGRTVRAYGNVQPNERTESASTSRLEGWIESLTVRAEGDLVRPGALLYRIYSPDLIAAQKDYLASVKIGNENRIASVRQRLRSLGMQPAAINQLASTGKLIERIPVYAETGGTVKSLEVREGDYVKPGTPVLRLQSYGDVWIIASVTEMDLPFIDTGMAVSLSIPSAPDAASTGKVDYVYPTIDPKTRTAQVRILADNASGSLRPGAYADVSFDLGGEERLSIPSEAVLRDSSGAHVIVALGDGRFDARSVQTGVSSRGLTEILGGLEFGEDVVASGQFLLDSEVNLREGLAKLSGSEAPK
jgi:membrane fusion protein, copper/silver efflux system